MDVWGDGVEVGSGVMVWWYGMWGDGVEVWMWGDGVEVWDVG